MNLNVRIIKGTILLTTGLIAAQGLSFIRNIIVARILSPEDMGLAAIFAMTISLLEMISNLAVDMLIVQKADGGDPNFQATAHSYQVIRGLLVGTIIFISGPFIANYFSVPHAGWAFKILALVPIFRGFMHLDWKRQQREFKYLNTIIVEVSPQIVATMASFPLSIWLKDYSTMLWLVLLQAFICFLVSHLIAQRTYRLILSKNHIVDIFNFGWPLVINGALMFCAIQGDRLIIGSFYTLSDLGVFSVVFSLIWAIIMIFSKIGTSIFLPILSKLQKNLADFQRQYISIVQFVSLIGGIIAIPLIISGGHITNLVFGPQYDAFSLAPFLGGILAVRMFRIPPTIAALSFGDSKNSMIANMFRCLSIGPAIFAAWLQLPLWTILICSIIGEILSLTSAAWRLHKLHGVYFITTILTPIKISLFIAGIAIIHCYPECLTTPTKSFGISFFVILILSFLGVSLFKNVRGELQKKISTTINLFKNRN